MKKILLIGLSIASLMCSESVQAQAPWNTNCICSIAVPESDTNVSIVGLSITPLFSATTNYQGSANPLAFGLFPNRLELTSYWVHDGMWQAWPPITSGTPVDFFNRGCGGIIGVTRDPTISSLAPFNTDIHTHQFGETTPDQNQNFDPYRPNCYLTNDGFYINWVIEVGGTTETHSANTFGSFGERIPPNNQNPYGSDAIKFANFEYYDLASRDSSPGSPHYPGPETFKTPGPTYMQYIVNGEQLIELDFGSKNYFDRMDTYERRRAYMFLPPPEPDFLRHDGNGNRQMPTAGYWNWITTGEVPPRIAEFGENECLFVFPVDNAWIYDDATPYDPNGPTPEYLHCRMVGANPSAHYIVQYKTNLNDVHWLELTNWMGSSIITSNSYTDGLIPTLGHDELYYRVKVDGMDAVSDIYGYHRIVVGGGQSVLLANQFEIEDAMLISLLPNVPSGCTIRSQRFPNSIAFEYTFDGTNWGDGDYDVISLAGGIMFSNAASTNLSIKMCGKVASTGLVTPIYRGMSVLSYLHPKGGTLDELGFPAREGDVISLLTNNTYVNYCYTNQAWVPGCPRVERGQAFMVNKAISAYWVVNKTLVNEEYPCILDPRIYDEAVLNQDIAFEDVIPHEFDAPQNATNRVVRWTAIPGSEYCVQTSTDLQNWYTQTPLIRALAGGKCFAVIPSTDDEVLFYRLSSTTDDSSSMMMRMSMAPDGLSDQKVSLQESSLAKAERIKLPRKGRASVHPGYYSLQKKGEYMLIAPDGVTVTEPDENGKCWLNDVNFNYDEWGKYEKIKRFSNLNRTKEKRAAELAVRKNIVIPTPEKLRNTEVLDARKPLPAHMQRQLDEYRKLRETLKKYKQTK